MLVATAMLLGNFELGHGHDYSISDPIVYNMQGCPDDIGWVKVQPEESEVTRACAKCNIHYTRHTFKPANSIVHSS